MRTLVLLLLTGAVACGPCGLGEPDPPAYQDRYSARLFSYRTGEPLVGMLRPYDHSAMRILDEQLRDVPDAVVRQDGLILIPIADQATDTVMDQVYEKRYYLQLTPSDTDTLWFRFTLHADPCSLVNYGPISMAYNDSLYQENATTQYQKLYKK